MKKGRQIIVFLFLFTGIGCSSWIEVEPQNSVTYTNYFKTEKDAQALLYNLHWNLRNLPTPFSEITEFAKNPYDKGDYLPMMTKSWTMQYRTIEAADIIIDNAFRFPLPKEVITPYVLQAYFAKASAYYSLGVDFGEAPVIAKGGSYEKYGKSPVSAVLDEAEKYALLAMDLPKYEDLKIEGVTLCKQYASKGAAAALLAKLYAWRAGVEGKEECWAMAEDYCTKIIENETGFYALESSPDAVCIMLKGDSKETIWEFFQDKKEKAANFYSSTLAHYNGLVNFPVVVTGNPTHEGNYMVMKEVVNNLFDKADLRKSAYFWGTDADTVYVKTIDGKTVADTVRGKEVVDKIAVYDNQAIKRAFLYKFRHPYYDYSDNNPKPRFAGYDAYIVKYRLADIILLRAECRARQGKANAVDDLNAIRHRSYGDDSHAYPCADDQAKGLAGDIQLAIYREREKELLLESHRYYDARRNGLEYVRRLLPAYADLSDQDIEDGALYLGIEKGAFTNNDLIRQNVYWHNRQQ